MSKVELTAFQWRKVEAAHALLTSATETSEALTEALELAQSILKWVMLPNIAAQVAEDAELWVEPRPLDELELVVMKLIADEVQKLLQIRDER